MTNKNRISILDSFRAIAALGVLWIHIWTIHNQPKMSIANYDFTKLINIVGNGVDLFFVISGFCMYYFYAKDKEDFSINDAKSFLIKRWIRLSPLFYFSTFIYLLISTNSFWIGTLKFLTSVLYLNSFSIYNAESFMWSLGTEWQFYIVVSVMLMMMYKIGFYRTMFYSSATFLLIAGTLIFVFKNESAILTEQIPFRFFEFLWGIIIGKLLTDKKNPKLNKSLLLILAILVAYLGRFLLSELVLSYFGNYRNMLKLFGYNVMALGFSLMIYICLNSRNFLTILIGNNLFYFIGRISFSFYLWHTLVYRHVANILMINYSSATDLGLCVTNFAISILILIPLSYITYVIFELKFSNYLMKVLNAKISNN